jgi:hypothetical protein
MTKTKMKKTDSRVMKTKLISEKLAQKTPRHETSKLLDTCEISEDTYEIVLKLVPNLLTCMNFRSVFSFHPFLDLTTGKPTEISSKSCRRL